MSGTRKIISALRGARKVIAGERDVIVACGTLDGDLTTADRHDRATIKKYDTVLAKIDAALAAIRTVAA